MWAIFCSLALCTFQILFADADTLEVDISASQFPLSEKLNDVQLEAFSDVAAAAKAVKIKEMKWDQIVERCTSTDFDQRFVTSFQTKFNKCDQCYDKAKNAKDIQTAGNCCKKLIEEFKKDKKVYIALAKTCIAKCAQDANKCGEEITNIENGNIKEYQNAAKDDTKKV